MNYEIVLKTQKNSFKITDVEAIRFDSECLIMDRKFKAPNIYEPRAVFPISNIIAIKEIDNPK